MLIVFCVLETMEGVYKEEGKVRIFGCDTEAIYQFAKEHNLVGAKVRLATAEELGNGVAKGY